MHDQGSSAKAAVVQVQGVQAVGVIDSSSDITLMGEELFAREVIAAHLRKKDLKKPDRVTYDHRGGCTRPPSFRCLEAWDRG